MSPQVRFYNPREASPEVLEAMLVGREDILQEILGDLKRQASSSSRQHWLLRGPRGIGKTHLVGIIYHRIRQSEKLSKRYLPIWLAETEAYSAYSAAVLLLQIAEQLVEELRLQGDAGAQDLDKRLQGLEPAGDDPALFEEVCEILKEESSRRGKILLVLTENLDALLTSYSGQRGAKEIRRLRALLSEEREFLFLSTTPTHFLALSDPKQPLYGHLKERNILSLDEEQLGTLLEQLARLTGRTEILKQEGSEEDFQLRRRVLHRLTGGNPRAVVMAFSVLSGSPGIQAIVQEISALLDAQTAYFEARLAQLAPRERAIVTAMALAQENLTAKEIAEHTRLPLRALSTQINRLIEQGYLGYAEGEGGKGTIYEVSDGMFRLWHQYRKGRKILQPIVRFLALLHPTEDLLKVRAGLEMALAGTLSHFEREILETTIRQVEEAIRFLESEEGQRARRQIWDEEERAWIELLKDFRELTEIAIKSTWPDELRKSFTARYVGLLRRMVVNAKPELLSKIVTFLNNFEDTEFFWNTAAGLYLLVLRVLEPTLQGRKAGQTNMARRSLARIPPELRKAVELTVEEILAERRSRQNHLSRTR